MLRDFARWILREEIAILETKIEILREQREKLQHQLSLLRNNNRLYSRYK